MVAPSTPELVSEVLQLILQGNLRFIHLHGCLGNLGILGPKEVVLILDYAHAGLERVHQLREVQEFVGQ